MRTITALLGAALAASASVSFAQDTAKVGSVSHSSNLQPSCAWAAEPSGDRHYRGCYRSEAGEYHFQLPADLRNHPEVAAQVDRVDAELSEGMDMVARQDRDDAKAGGLTFAPWEVDLTWELAGINRNLASLIATGTLSPRPSRNPHAEPHQAAIAMLVDRRTGRFLTDATDAFTDQMVSARSTYCALLDIQRIANALDADPAAGSKGLPKIVDAEGRYLGKWSCPYFGELAIGFAGDAGQPFDRIELVAEPGIAGPEREGYYRVTMKITPALLSQVRSDYREGFRAATGCEDCIEKAPAW